MSINTKTNISSRTKNSKKEVEIIDSEKISMKKLIDIEQTIFNLTYENIDLSIKKINKLFDSSYPYSDNLIICNLVYFAFCSKRNSCDLYINYIETLQSKEVEVNKNNQNFTEIFIDDLCKRGSQESYYLINQMIERNIIDKKITKKIKSKYFAHLKKKEEIQYINLSDPRERIFNDNFDKLSKNDWELHKKLIKEGQSPNEIAKIIRNDEIEKLQEISTQNEFNFNQIIEPSLYERCSFINQRNVSLIDCAAFFGSIKCFKFLLMNGANVNNTGKYAIAGGNVEIIHLCEQNNASFDDAYETAIMYHRNDIFKYFYERNLKEAQPKTTSNYMINSFAYENNIVKLYENLLCLCITSGNYEILSNLLENGMKINDNVINITAKTGNLYLVKYFLQHYQIPNNIIVYASDSGNIELVKYIFEQERKKLNSKDI